MSTATADSKKSGNTIIGKLPLPSLDLDDARKPAYAWVGVADLVIEQVKEAPADAQARAKKLQDRVPAQVKELPTQVKELPTTLTELPGKAVTAAKEIPAQVKKARETAEARVTKAQETANARYADLAARGEKLVGQIRRQQATQDAIAEGKRAVQKAEAAANNAKRSAKAAAKAAEGAAAKIG